ncbi:hypothetical protein ACNJX9_35165 [Bradyrhizobium sp. DASA03076]|uniref:hypothetical protein n=1 Tax=Bradyrhizobium sp. BLXBL-03 TaxID=3395916 RepID=UPI003F72D02B
MDLLITDVTEMAGGNYCVAGWDVVAKRMVRPLPNGTNWPAILLDQHGMMAGRIVRVTPHGGSNGIFPHRTEDTPIDQTSIRVSNEVFSDWLGATAPQFVPSLRVAFGRHLSCNAEWNGVKRGVHVNPGVQCSSLIAVRIPKEDLSFADSFGKLKAVLNDGSDKYQLAVSSKVLKEAWQAGGLAAVNNALPVRAEFHVRIGLARPFDDPPKCYAMLNGIL